jgi:hypothetical protein
MVATIYGEDIEEFKYQFKSENNIWHEQWIVYYDSSKRQSLD